MLISVYLHDEIASILKCYGTIDEVVNRVLDEASSGAFDFEDKPSAPDRSGARRYDVDVKNNDYLEVYRMCPNSHKISLRRLLYWFVENEMYDMLGWEATHPYTSKSTEKCKRLIEKARQSLEALCTVITGDDYNLAIQSKNLIEELEKRYG